MQNFLVWIRSEMNLCLLNNFNCKGNLVDMAMAHLYSLLLIIRSTANFDSDKLNEFIYINCAVRILGDNFLSFFFIEIFRFFTLFNTGR